MIPWIVPYKQGLRELARHEPLRALGAFHAAISACPVTQISRLARILFYTGATLKKIGAHDEAVHAWAISQKLVKRGPILRYMRWFANEYGMAKQDFADTDDWRAFYAMQLKNYLEIKQSSRMGSRGEKSMIRDLIYDTWASLKSSGCLESMNCSEKIAFFRSVPIVFPLAAPPVDAGIGAE
ncbi:MAG: hypothetical protein FWG35_00795 [Spirochaetaceae bacterium]|nr:hypothetical protein [Spirochaetaceae bacterium]